jgi:alpha-tubulin suppressor-like RCC1 family protein
VGIAVAPVTDGGRQSSHSPLRQGRCSVATRRRTWLVGSGLSIALGLSSLHAESTPPKASDANAPSNGAVLSNAVSITSGSGHVCVLLKGGKVQCWGANFDGQLGNGTTAHSSLPVAVLGITSAIAVAAANDSTCALLEGGKLSCWGMIPSLDYYPKRSAVPAAIAGVTGAIAVVPGGDVACVLLDNGSAKCWGRNVRGQLGTASTVGSASPVELPGLGRPVAITESSEFGSCVVLKNGTAKCWGRGDHGRLGSGATADSPAPIGVAGVSNAVDIVSGTAGACALLAGGTIRCWGWNHYGQLGNGSTLDSPVPVAVSGIANAAAVTYGDGHHCALQKDGTVQCWGWNFYGQLGNGSTTNSPVPVRVTGISNAESIITKFNRNCATMRNGVVRCWGATPLGNGAWKGSSLPVAVASVTHAISVVSGLDHTCALLRDGTAKCWGDNHYGQIGDGTTEQRLTPVTVAALRVPPPNCEGSWPNPVAKQLTDTEVRRWFEENKLSLPASLPTCHRSLSWPSLHRSALLCSRREVHKSGYSEVFVDVLGAGKGQLEHWLSLPVAAGVTVDPSCKNYPTIGSPLAQLEVALGPGNGAMIVREPTYENCVDRLSRLNQERDYATVSAATYAERQSLIQQVCASRGVYVWKGGNLTKSPDGIVLAGPAAAVQIKGGQLTGPCVDPYSHIQTQMRAPSQRFVLSEKDANHRLYLDLDGVQPMDLQVPDDVNLPKDSEQRVSHLYVLRGECAYYVGDVVGSPTPTQPNEQTHQGLNELKTSPNRCSVVDPKGDPARWCNVIWSFNGTRYVRSGVRPLAPVLK